MTGRMRTVATTWIEGPDGVLSVMRYGPKEFVVKDHEAMRDPILYRTDKKDRAIGWAKCKVGIVGDDRDPGDPAPTA